MKKTLTALTAAAAFALVTVAAPQPAQAGGKYRYGHKYGNNYGNVAAGIIGGLAVGALIGAAAANSSGYYGPSRNYYYAPSRDYYYRPRCWWSRERYWNGYHWRAQRVRVCD